MRLRDIDEDWAEELLSQRYFSEFENHWEELSNNSPEVSNNQYQQILKDADEICRGICRSLHHELEVCIYDDYILIATYLIADMNDKYIAGMLQSYLEGEIPMLSIKPTDKSLQKVFNKFHKKINQ